MIFQSPYSSLDPRMSVGEILAEGLVVNRLATGREDRRERVLAALADVGLPADVYQRRPKAFSGGQRQRIAIARALVVEPRVLICDEVVSSLDVSIQAQICNLLADLRAKRGVAILFIAHDLGVVRQLCHRVAVMSEGSIVETGPTASVLTSRHTPTRSPWSPQHPSQTRCIPMSCSNMSIRRHKSPQKGMNRREAPRRHGTVRGRP